MKKCPHRLRQIAHCFRG
ncbi:MAG: hypothetical protein EXR25_10485 [Limnohabitans sp.]|nr:hypothetical protein [Limnohabitans sp.]